MSDLLDKISEKTTKLEVRVKELEQLLQKQTIEHEQTKAMHYASRNKIAKLMGVVRALLELEE